MSFNVIVLKVSPFLGIVPYPYDKEDRLRREIWPSTDVRYYTIIVKQSTITLDTVLTIARERGEGERERERGGGRRDRERQRERQRKKVCGCGCVGVRVCV